MQPENEFAQGPGNRSMPASTVIPVLHYRDVPSAVAELCSCFGFSERLRIGTHRVQLDVGSGAVVVAHAQGDGPSAPPPSSNHSLMIRVADADAHFARARSAGIQLLSEPTTFPYGERQYSAVDAGGHVWTFSQTVRDTDPAEWGGEFVRRADER
jgi:uncharacterized glyoxalase superfamily protein PhnB